MASTQRGTHIEPEGAIKLSIAYMKMLAEVRHDYLKLVGNDPDGRKRIKFVQVLLADRSQAEAQGIDHPCS
jgi:hypothetical protein